MYNIKTNVKFNVEKTMKSTTYNMVSIF